jgi:1-acyl-sn-glycerol-3-phosphate acyltransferase
MKVPALETKMPVIEGQAPIRWIGSAVIAASRWRVIGPFPNVPKVVSIAAPHSSLWDGLFGLSAAYAIGVRAHWMGKNTLFKGGFGALMRALGGIATDRSNPRGAVGQMVDKFRQSERFWLFIAPEGTRRPVEKWRTGFWHIAHEASVPILPVAFDWDAHVVHVLPLFTTSGDREADLAALYRLYAPYLGKHGKRAVPAEFVV